MAAYLVPQVMAYAGIAGLPPVAGLWAMLAPLALYALLGSSRHPTAVAAYQIWRGGQPRARPG